MIRKHVLVLVLSMAASIAAQDADGELRKKLASIRVDANYEDAPLSFVVEHIRETTKLNVLVDTRAIQDPDAYRVSFQLRNVRADHLLRWALFGRGLTWVVRDGVILITTLDGGAAARGDLRLYAVSDLLTQPRDFPADEAEQSSGFTVEDLKQLLTEMVAPGSWDSSERSLESTQGHIVAVCPPEVHAAIEYVLSSMRYLANFTVTIEARVVDLGPGALEGAPSLGSLAPGRVILSKEEAAALLAPPAGTAEVQEAIRFTCVNGQRMHVVLSRSREGLQGMLTRWADTVAHTRTAETVLEVLPILAVGRDEGLLDLDARLADPPTALETLETPSGALQLGSSGTRRVRTSVSAPNGGGVLFALGARENRVRALFLRVTSNAQPLTVTPALSETAEPVDDAALKSWNRFRTTPISVDLDNAKLAEFVRRVQESGEINCVIDPILVDDGSTESPIQFRVKDVPGELVLKLVTQMLGIGYAFRDEALFFTRPDRVEESVVQVYDVRDLMWTLRDYPGPVFEKAEEAGAWMSLSTETREAYTVDQLVETIRRNIEPATWDDPGRATIVSLSGALFVLQAPSVHEKMREFLEAVRSSPPRQVHVDARVIELDASVHDALDAGGGGALPEASRAAIEGALAAGQGRVAAIWSILGLNGQRFHATVLSEREYVDDYDADEKTGAPDPVYKLLQWGHALDLRATLPAVAEGSLSVELHAQCCDASDPLPTQQTGDLTVQTPSVDRASLHTTVIPEAGRTYLFTLGSSASSGADRRRVLLLTVQEAK